VRIGLIADIHGNLLALETVLAELRYEHVDRVICLGDIAALGPQPGKCLARVRNLGGVTVLGNTDEWLLRGVPADTSQPVAELTAWAAERLSAADRAFLSDLPLSGDAPLRDGGTLLAYHGSPRSNEDVIAATTSDAALGAMFGGRSADIMAGGHTHVQLMRAYRGGRIVNPGSVGLPGVGPGGPRLETNEDVSWAEYAVLTAAEGGISIDLRRTALNLPKMLRAAKASKMPQLDWWAAHWRGV
jgi:predicted phosphodiesterase